MVTERKTADERKAILAWHIEDRMKKGGRIESQSDYQAVFVYGRRVNHVLHFLVGIFTFGFWWLVWAVLAMTGGEMREMVVVDEWGKASESNL